MSRGKIILIAVVLLLMAGGGFWFVRGARGSSVPQYRFGEVRSGTVESTVTSTGRLNAIRSVAVGTQVSGRVTELYADFNDRVREGQLIARIDPTLQQQAVRNAMANLERVRAALAQAERDYNRNRTLFEQQVITETEFHQVEYSLTVARSNLTSAEVSLEQARQNLSYTEIYAPIDGIVVERNVEPGQTVAASLSAPQLYLIASDLAQMEILASVDESDIGEIRTGMPVRFTVQAYPNDNFVGEVKQVRLSSATSENVVNYTAVISVRNEDMRLLPGMTATVDFIVERAENVFMVPNAALRFRPTEEMIAQLTDSTMIAMARGGGMGGAMAARAAQARMQGQGQGQGQTVQGQTVQGQTVQGQTVQVPGGAAGASSAQGATGGGPRTQGFTRGQIPGAGPGASAGGPSARADAQGGGNGAEPAAGRSPATGAFIPGGQAPQRMVRASFANLWYLKDGQLALIQVRTGVSDGTNTEIFAPDLEEGMEIILGLNQPQASGSTGTTNPFQQQGGFGPGGGPVFIGPGGGGFGGPGGGGGAGGRR